MKTILLTKKVKLGKKEKLILMDYKVDAITNAVQLIKAWIEAKSIDRVINNENGDLINNEINTAIN